MKKKWMVLMLVLVLLLLFWQLGGMNYFLAKTIFAPDYKDDSIEENNEEPDPNVTTKEKEKFTPEELEYKVEILAEGLEIPWEIVPLSEDRFLVTERPGRVVLLDQGNIYTVYDVEHIGEGGLLGMALSPDFKENKEIFLYYTYRERSKIFNRVSKFIFEENTLKEERYVLDGIPGARFHNGGRIKFGPDDKLYITTGDAQESSLSQDITSLAGKILRINADGTIPKDNPFDNSPVYVYGLRNPQGLSWHPFSGELFASDHGPNSQDEVNRILPGENYGWPSVTCNDGDTEYRDPIACYSDFTLAPSGISFLPLENLSEWPLYVAGLRGNMIMRIDLDEESNVMRQESIFNEYGRIRSVVSHEDSLYILTNNRDGRGIPQEGDDKIIKITPYLP